jgi:polar amino acid transport system substrate-binding protein
MGNNLWIAACKKALVCMLVCAPLSAYSACSRIIKVPISPIGLSVIAEGDTVSGVYPDLLRSAQEKSGCTFEFSVVPRARLEAMYKEGSLDILVPATKSPMRDESGVFIPMVLSRPSLIALPNVHPSPRSMKELIAHTKLRVAVVRGFDFGTTYLDALKELAAQGRLVEYTDPVSVARMLDAGLADVTIMPPSILLGAIYGEPRTSKLFNKLRFEPLKEFDWGYAGIYLSKTSLNDADRAVLKDLLEQTAKSGAVWTAFQHYYPAKALDGSVKPLK